MDSNKFKVFGFIFIAFIFSIYIGTAAATAQTEAIAWVAVIFYLGICLMLGKNVWLLIPATLALKGGVNFLPGMVQPWVFATMTTAVFFAVRVAVGSQKVKFRWTKMETAILLTGLTIIQAMVRNPVGLQALGGESAGGKPYFIFFFAFLAYYLINASQPTMKLWRKAIIMYIVFGVLDGLLMASSAIVPEIAQIVARVYTNVDGGSAMGSDKVYALSERRFGFLMQLGTILGLIACSFWRPLSAVDFTKPWRGVVAVTSLGCILLSGFRSSLALLAVRFIIGSKIRKKSLDVVFVAMVTLLGLSAILVSGKALKLPFGIQRILTVLPFEIDLHPDAVSQAENSSEDRFEVWRMALESDRYIKNKMIGDGFQFSAVEINAMSDSRFAGSGYGHISFVERSLGVANYHGFHVETIRFTGVVGLVAATFAMFVFLCYARRAIQFHRDTEIWPYVIFACLPFLIYPFWYWLIFGSYRTGFPEMIAFSGMIKVIYELGRESRLRELAEQEENNQDNSRNTIG